MISTIRKMARRAIPHYPYSRFNVQSGLSVTPSEMLALAQQGIPISSHFDDSKFDDGDTKSLGSIDFIHQRGLDIVDVWEHQKSSRKKLLDAQAKDVQMYGE